MQWGQDWCSKINACGCPFDDMPLWRWPQSAPLHLLTVGLLWWSVPCCGGRTVQGSWPEHATFPVRHRVCWAPRRNDKGWDRRRSASPACPSICEQSTHTVRFSDLHEEGGVPLSGAPHQKALPAVPEAKAVGAGTFPNLVLDSLA
jgi:hypothetical protein